MTGPARHSILVVNQHGDNRGDEAAMLAMLEGLRARLGPCRFTVVAQVGHPGAGFPVPDDTAFLGAVPRLRSVPGLVLASLARLVGRDAPRSLLDGFGRRLLDAYRDAELVVSAPGGPYFGDVYWRHEPLHWWYAWLGTAAGTPTFLFATSAGPYRRPLWNRARRRLLRRFAAPLVVRESVSAEHLRGLLGAAVAVETTTDSALMVRVPPLDRAAELGSDADRFIVAVSAIDRGSAVYDDAFRAVIRHLHITRAAHFVLLPQRYGADTDVAYLQQLIAPLDHDVSWELFDPARDATAQRGLVAMADLTLAGRYHPLVFAISAHVPVVPVAYEHKAVGVATDAGLDELLLRADDLTAAEFVAAVEMATADLDGLRRRIAEAEPALRAAAGTTADLAVAARRATA